MLDGGNLDFLVSGLEKRPKKKVRHTLGIVESKEQVYFGYGVKNRRIGAAAMLNPPHPPKKGTENEAKKKKHKKREEEARTHSSGDLLLLL